MYRSSRSPEHGIHLAGRGARPQELRRGLSPGLGVPERGARHDRGGSLHDPRAEPPAGRTVRVPRARSHRRRPGRGSESDHPRLRTARHRSGPLRVPTEPIPSELDRPGDTRRRGASQGPNDHRVRGGRPATAGRSGSGRAGERGGGGADPRTGLGRLFAQGARDPQGVRTRQRPSPRRRRDRRGLGSPAGPGNRSARPGRGTCS